MMMRISQPIKYRDFSCTQSNKCHCVSYIPQKGETNQFNADADGEEEGSKNVVWDDKPDRDKPSFQM